MLVFFERESFQPIVELNETAHPMGVRWLLPAQDPALSRWKAWFSRAQDATLSTVTSVPDVDGRTYRTALETYPVFDPRVRPKLIQEMDRSGLLLIDVRPNALPYWQEMQRMKLPAADQYRLLSMVNMMPEKAMGDWEAAWNDTIRAYA